jgi:hypothetical protein
LLDDSKPIRFGVVSDTHIPDRARSLPENVLNGLRNANVDLIFHAGDVSCLKVIHTLEKIAPVKTVQGNRDWFLGLSFPKQISLSYFGINLVLTHGHRSVINYLFDKWAILREGYQFSRYQKLLAQDFPLSDIIIFGHTHRQEIRWVEGQLFFNPGAAYPCKYNQYHPQFGILAINPNGEIQANGY